jgi:hypothetical protein
LAASGFSSHREHGQRDYLFVLDWQKVLNLGHNADGEVAMDGRIGNNYNMQVRLHFFANES